MTTRVSKPSPPTGPELVPVDPDHDRWAVTVNGVTRYAGSRDNCETRLKLLTRPDPGRERQDAFLHRAIAAVVVLLLTIGSAAAETLPLVPDDTLTPGVVASTDEAEVCATGPNGTYSQQHRQTTEAMKRQVYQRYAVEPQGRDFEIDHRLPLALGGKDDIGNLWPQQGWQHPSFHDKDKLEAYLWRQVCKAHAMPLGEAQKLLLGDWRESYKQVFGASPM